MNNSPKKQVILEAAAALFRDRGYAATSMRDLAKAVHLQASSLYNHISSKQEILADICFQNAHRFLDGLDKIEKENTNALTKIEVLLKLHLTIAIEDVTSITSFNDEWRHLEEPHLSKFIELRKKYENRFKLIIEEGIKEGVFKDINSTIALNTLLSSIRWVYDWYKPDGKQSIEEVAFVVNDLLLGGLKR